MKKFQQFVNEAYVSNEKTKQVRNDLKSEFPEFKFSIRKEHYSKINVAIISGPIPLTDKGYENVNIFWVKEHYAEKPEVRDFLLKVLEIINKGNYDKSDIMTDYFDVGFYVDLSIGQWDRPYEVVNKTKKTIKDIDFTRYKELDDDEKPRTLRYFEYNSNEKGS
jgi:hypothetical protein